MTLTVYEYSMYSNENEQKIIVCNKVVGKQVYSSKQYVYIFTSLKCLSPWKWVSDIKILSPSFEGHGILTNRAV